MTIQESPEQQLPDRRFGDFGSIRNRSRACAESRYIESSSGITRRLISRSAGCRDVVGCHAISFAGLRGQEDIVDFRRNRRPSRTAVPGLLHAPSASGQQGRSGPVSAVAGRGTVAAKLRVELEALRGLALNLPIDGRRRQLELGADSRSRFSAFTTAVRMVRSAVSGTDQHLHTALVAIRRSTRGICRHAAGTLPSAIVPSEPQTWPHTSPETR